MRYHKRCVLKLKEFIEQYTKDKDTVFMVGAASSFFFIGTADEFKRDAYKIDAEFIKAAQAGLKKSPPKTDSPQEEQMAEKIQEDQTAFIGGNSRTGVSDKQAYIDSYIPIKEREVLESYPRLQGDGIIVGIEGTESGKFWYKEEYDAALERNSSC